MMAEVADTLPTEITDALPSLKQKFLVDLVNGIDVSRDYIKVQKDRDGFVHRLWDSFTGDSHRRQAQINDLVVSGLDSCFEWLGELTEQLTFTNSALVQISDGLGRVKRDLAIVAHHAADTRQQLNQFQQVVDRRMTKLEATIRAVDIRQRAHQQMESLFISWEAGNFSSLSPAQRCFLVLSELGWGVFADYCRIATAIDREQILQDLRNRLTIQLMRDSGKGRDERVDATLWLQNDLQGYGLPQDRQRALAHDYQQALRYLGDRLDPQEQGLNWFVVNGGDDRPTKVPFIMDATRLVKGMTRELIWDGRFYVG